MEHEKMVLTDDIIHAEDIGNDAMIRCKNRFFDRKHN